MTDTRERARSEAERIVSNAETATQFEFREEDDYRGTITLNVEAGLVAFAESEAALARKQEREANCAAICTHCSAASNSSKYTGKAEKRNGKWVHQEVGFKAEDAFDCRAAAIHERNLAETGGAK